MYSTIELMNFEAMTGRTTQTEAGKDYRYGFNGKEKDVEGMGGGGSTYDYGFRIYNPRIAKFLSVDPLTKSYPMLTPYQFASNRPIDGIDLDGLEYSPVIMVNKKIINGLALLNNWLEKGVYFSYNEINGGIGLMTGASYTNQFGVAFDEIGTVYYDISGSFAGVTGPSNNNNFFAGLDVGYDFFGKSWDKGSKTFKESVTGPSPVSFSTALIFDFHYFVNKFGFEIGLSGGVALGRVDYDKFESYAFSGESELNLIKYMMGSGLKMELGEIKKQFDTDGNLIGLKSEITFRELKGEGKTYNSGIEMNSNINDNGESDGFWESNNYNNEEDKK